MDPNANLKEQLELAAIIQADGMTPEESRLAELVIALNDWIEKGGFLPTAWQEVA